MQEDFFQRISTHSLDSMQGGTATSDGESIEFTYCDLISDLEKVINYAQVYFGESKNCFARSK